MDEALKQLHDLHLPAEPALWPPAPGWWVLAAVAVGLTLWGAGRIRSAWVRRRPFRIAIAALDDLLRRSGEHDASAREFADAVNALLKRALIHGAHRAEAAALTGDAWLNYLDRVVSDNVFSRGAGYALGHDRFAPDFTADPHRLHAAAMRVLRALHAEKQVTR